MSFNHQFDKIDLKKKNFRSWQKLFQNKFYDPLGGVCCVQNPKGRDSAFCEEEIDDDVDDEDDATGDGSDDEMDGFG